MEVEDEEESVLQQLFVDSSNTLGLDNVGFQFDVKNVVISDSDVEDEDEQAFNQLTERHDLMELRDRMELELKAPRLPGGAAGKAKPPKKRKRKTKNALPRHLRNIMSEANFAYIERNFGTAVEKLQELIRHAPKTMEAWTLLTQVYMETEQLDKALAAYLIATQVDRKRIDLFQEAGALAFRLNRPDVALTCYNRVLKTLSGNVECLLERARCQCALKQLEKAGDTYAKIIKLDPENLAANEEWAHVLSAMGKTQQSISLLKAVGNRLSPTGNILLGDLLMETGDYELAHASLRTAVEKTTSIAPDSKDAEVVRAFDGDFIPIELQVRLGICRLYIDCHSATARLYFGNLFEKQEKYDPVFYYEVVGAYMKLRLYEQALEILTLLNSWKATNTPHTWEQMAVCYHKLNRLESAKSLYEVVLDSLPNNVDVQLALADVYEQLGEEEKALELFERVQDVNLIEDLTDDRENVAAVAKCDLLFRKPLRGAVLADFLRTAETPLLRLLNHRQFFKHLRSSRNGKWDQFHVSRVFRRFDFAGPNSLNPDFTTAESNEAENAELGTRDAEEDSWQGCSEDDWYRLVMQFGTVSLKDGDSNRALSVLDRASDCLLFPRPKAMKLRMFMMSIAFSTRQYGLVFDLCRWFCNRHKSSDFFYRLYLQLASTDSLTYSEFYSSQYTSRWCKRQLQYRQQVLFRDTSERFLKLMEASSPLSYGFKSFLTADNFEEASKAFAPTLAVFLGHQFSNTKFFRLAIQHYLRAFVIAPQDTLVNLCLGIACLSRAMQRQTENRNKFIKLGFGFIFNHLSLAERQGSPLSEANYNVARAFHQVGLVQFAVYWYEKALAISDAYSDCIAPLAAYQLSLVYLNSRSGLLAKELLIKYCSF